MTDAQVAGGHKATLNNPHASDEAKEHSKKVLEGEYNGGDGQFALPQTGSHTDTVQTSLPIYR